MTRSKAELERVRELLATGYNDCQTSRVTGIPRTTVRDWRIYKGRARPRQLSLGVLVRDGEDGCPRCTVAAVDEPAYAYLLGLYLGDGCLSPAARDVFKLRIALDFSYPGIIGECFRAINAVKHHGAEANVVACVGCVEVYSFWKHWPCLFPQHGPGPKHRREIVLADWQEAIAARHPGQLLRGLIHSDGGRFANKVKGKVYWRYQFSNHSRDIQDIFCRACDRIGVKWKRSYWKTISVSRRSDVATLDFFVGPKA
jgi:hypothetical protein